ncbi:MAG: glycosyltransferase family 2 protein [Planctomycetota bacterium]
MSTVIREGSGSAARIDDMMRDARRGELGALDQYLVADRAQDLAIARAYLGHVEAGPPPAPGRQPRVAVLIPCYNEEATVGKVIEDFRRELPDAEIVVFNNRSEDRTVEIALAHGARVLHEPRRGKGNVIAAMFGTVDADIYVMIDGDDTYPAEEVGRVLAPLLEGRADMVVATRLQEYTSDSFRPLHVLGNNLVRGLVNRIFGARLTDIMSGYRAYGRRVAEGLPVVSSGFEIETEMTINALYYRYEIAEVQVPYRERPEGSVSKLRTFHDGFRVLWRLFSLFRAYKPLTFFGSFSLVLAALSLWAGWAPVSDYVREGYVHTVPRAILATGLALLSGGFLFLGILLHAFNWRLKEIQNLVTRRR